MSERSRGMEGESYREMFVGESTQGLAVKGFLEADSHSSSFEVYSTISSRPAQILKQKR